MIVRYTVLFQAVSECGTVDSIAVDLRDVRQVWRVKIEPPRERPGTMLLVDEGTQLVLAGCDLPSPLLTVNPTVAALDVERARAGRCPRCGAPEGSCDPATCLRLRYL